MRVTVDVGYVIQCIFGLLPDVEKYREKLYYECPRLSPTLISDLREATAGLGHCEMLKRGGAEVANEDADNPVQVVRGIRTQLAFHGGPLVATGLLTKDDLTASPGNSPRDIAFDVMKFVAKIGGNFHHLEGRSMLTRADLDAATKAAEDLLEYLGAKERNTATAEETTLMRQRALTQVFELYEELRAGMRFARRRYKDHNTITPSLFAMRSKKASRDSDEGVSTTPESTTSPGSVTNDQDNTSGGIDLSALQALMSGALPGAGTSSTVTSSTATSSTATSNASGPTHTAASTLSSGVNPAVPSASTNQGFGDDNLRIFGDLGNLCALKRDGSLWCAGANHHSQIPSATVNGKKPENVSATRMNVTCD